MFWTNRIFVTNASANDLALLEIVNGNAFPKIHAIRLFHAWYSGNDVGAAVSHFVAELWRSCRCVRTY